MSHQSVLRPLCRLIFLLTIPVLSLSLATAYAAITLASPDIGEDSANVPITIRFSPPLQGSEAAVLLIDGAEAAALELKSGSVTEFSVRARMSQGAIEAIRIRNGKGVERTKRSIRISKPSSPNGVASAITETSVKAGSGEFRARLVSPIGFSDTVTVTDTGFIASITGSNLISTNTVVGLKGTVTESAKLSLSSASRSPAAYSGEVATARAADAAAAEKEAQLRREEIAANEKRIVAEQQRFDALLRSANPQAMYLAAGTYFRNGEASRANAVYEALISRFSSSEWAVKANDQLNAMRRADDAESSARGRQNDAVRQQQDASEKNRADCSYRISKCEDSCRPLSGANKSSCWDRCKSLCSQF